MQEDIGLICKQIGLFSYNKKKKKLSQEKIYNSAGAGA